MLWTALCVAATVAGAAIAAAGLLVRPTRLAVPVHAVGMALAFTAGSLLLVMLSEWIGYGATWASTIEASGWVLVTFILPFCVIAAIFATPALRWPRLTAAASALILAAFLLSPLRGSAGSLLATGAVSALLVLPTVIAHRYILNLPEADAARRFRAVAGWTLMNALLVVFLGRAYIMPLIIMERMD